MSNPVTDWTVDEIEVLRREWEAGKTCSKIGLLLNKSRCAVAGKARRLKLESRAPRNGHMTGTVPSKTPRCPRKRRPSTPVEGRAPVVRKKGMPAPPMFYPEATPLTASSPIGIMELNRHTCKAVVGRDEATKLAVYCGDMTFPGKPFCAGHCAMYYRHPEDRAA